VSLYDFFFPEQAQATHLRRLSEQTRRVGRGQAAQDRALDKLEDRIGALEDDLGFVSLVLGSVIAKLDEKGVLTRQDLAAAMREVDGVDGVADGKFDIRALRAMQR
jgi:predicted flap endonuclease-1-like 5' DNA nuclease